MVQKEAADRLAAVPGTRASSAISCAVNYYATSKLMFTAAPGSFYPAPKVTSAVVRMDIRPTPAVQVEDEAGYFALVRAAFGQRRKTAANAIAGGLNLPKEKVIAAIEAAGFDARIRPEALTLEDFAKIQRALAEQKSSIVGGRWLTEKRLKKPGTFLEPQGSQSSGFLFFNGYAAAFALLRRGRWCRPPSRCRRSG